MTDKQEPLKPQVPLFWCFFCKDHPTHEEVRQKLETLEGQVQAYERALFNWTQGRQCRICLEWESVGREWHKPTCPLHGMTVKKPI